MRSFAYALSGLVVVHLTLSVSCAHTDEAQQKRDRDQEREVGMLKERIIRIERRLSDLDAKLSLVIDEDPPGASRRISTRDMSTGSGAPEVDYRENRLPPPPAPKERIQIGIGSASVDIGSGEPDGSPAPEAGEPAEEAAPENPPAAGFATETVTIDENLLRQFDLAPKKNTPSDAKSRRSRTRGSMPRNVKALYRSAHTAMEAGDYEEAAKRFRAVEKRFAKHHLADNALYWRGVCYQRSGDRPHAVDVYQALPKRFPQSPKIADALFNLAEIAEIQGDKVMAKSIYERLLQRYPDAERSSEAAAAVDRLSAP